MSVPFQNNTDFGLGQYDRTRNVLNIQPVVPLAQGRVITRTIIPFVWLPDVTAESGSFSSGLSDIVSTAFYVPASGAFTWGVGPVIPNDRKKYSVGENAGMKLNADGGIEIYVAAEQPSGVPAENWLPIERKDTGLNLILLIYVPDLEKMKTWTPPKAERIGG